MAEGLAPRRDRAAARRGRWSRCCSPKVAARLVGSGRGGERLRAAHTGRRDRQPINALGYRDLERAQPKPAGVRRVVCLGDSFTWGVGVLFDDAWPQRVERTLSRTRGERWEAVNLAEPGMNAVQQASRLDSEGFGYGPDVVVMAWVMNDSEDEDAAEARRAGDWAEEQQRRRRARPRRLLDRSALVRPRAHAGSRRRSRTAAGSPATARCTRTTTRAGPRRASALVDDGRPVPRARRAVRGGDLPALREPARRALSVRGAAREGRAGRGGGGGQGASTCCRATASVDWRLLVVDGADDEHPNEIAHRIAAQAIARGVDEVVPRAARPPARP